MQANYLKFRNFRMNFNFANSVKRHIFHINNSQLGHDLLTTVNDRVISPSRKVRVYFHETSHMGNIPKFTAITYLWQAVFNSRSPVSLRAVSATRRPLQWTTFYGWMCRRRHLLSTWHIWLTSVVWNKLLNSLLKAIERFIPNILQTQHTLANYCKFENFRMNFNVANTV